MRGTTRVILQLHQKLPLPRKMNLMIDPHHIWNVICNARSNKSHPPTSPNTAPPTQNEWLIRVTYETSFATHGATRVILQLHQILPLPRKMNLMIDPHHIGNVIYNARSNKSHPPTSPNTAPATQNESHDWSASHMKCYLQCAEQQESPSNLTKYCACHGIWHAWLLPVTYETSSTMRGATRSTVQPHQILRLPRKMRHVQRAADPTMVRPWSEHDPTMNSSSRIRPFAEVTFHALEMHFVMKIITFRAPAIYPNLLKKCGTCHEKWHCNITKCCACQEKWHCNITKCCPCHEKWHRNFTKDCACHAKWISWLICITYEMLFTMRGATRVTLQPHQILHLPRKMTRMIDSRHIWNVIYNAQSNRQHPPTSPNTAPATQNCTPKSRRNLPKTVEASLTMRSRSDHDPTIDAFCIENYNVSRSGCLPKFHQMLRLPGKVTLQHHQMLRLPRKVTLQHHQKLRLPRTVTLLSRYFTELRLPRTVTLLNRCFIELLLYWTATLLNCYFTELLLY